MRNHSLAYFAGALTISILFFQSAARVGAEFSQVQVFGTGLAYLLIFAAMAAVSGIRPSIRFFRPVSSVLQVFVGIALAAYVSWRIGLEHPFLRYYQPSALQNLDLGIAFHQDTAFHSAIIQSILNVGYPSTGQHGTPVTFYYVLSHYLDAFVCRVTGLPPYQSAALFFEFKKLLLVLAISTFVMLITKNKPAIFRIPVMFVSMWVFIGTWSAVGSEGLWSATVLLLLAAPKLVQTMRKEILGWRQLGYLVLIVTLVSAAKLASGLMLAVVLGVLLLQRHFKNIWLWVSTGALVFMFAVAAILFSMSNKSSETRGFSLTDSINFLNFTTQEQSVEYLIAIYALVGVIGLFALLIRSRDLIQLLVASLVGILILGALASHFNKSDIYYFSFGLLYALMVVSLPILIEAINPRWSIKTLGAWVLSAAMVGSSFAMPQAYSHVFGLTSQQIESQQLHKFSVRATSLKYFESAFNAYLNKNHLGKANTLLFVPKWMFKNRKMQFKGQTWAHGLLLYAVTGVPLWHGSPELHDGYGFGSYSEQDLWVNRDTRGVAEQCGIGKNVVQLTSFSKPTFRPLCPKHR